MKKGLEMLERCRVLVLDVASPFPCLSKILVLRDIRGIELRLLIQLYFPLLNQRNKKSDGQNTELNHEGRAKNALHPRHQVLRRRDMTSSWH